MVLSVDDTSWPEEAFARPEPARSARGMSAFQQLEPRYLVEAQLVLAGGRFQALRALHSSARPRDLSQPHVAVVLEALAATADTAQALRLYLEQRPAADALIAALPRAPWEGASLELERGQLLFEHRGEPLDLTHCLRAGESVTRGLARRERLLVAEPSVDLFVSALDELDRAGLVAPPTARVALGHLTRPEPFCLRYGRSRGTIIDRHYLDRFVASIRHLVRGSTIEIGTSILTDDNKLKHGFASMTDYRTLDCVPGPGVDVCGDLHDPSLLAPGSIDSILCFNVLEHCADMQRVIDNMFEWLSPGGRVFCMVPSVQRVHEAPKDYWRPLPGGLHHLFAKYGERKLHVYGNLQATIAALCALAVEDLPPNALDVDHPDYPVATCIVATR